MKSNNRAGPLVTSFVDRLVNDVEREECEEIVTQPLHLQVPDDVRSPGKYTFHTVSDDMIFASKVQVDTDHKISLDTVSPSRSPRWFQERKIRISASKKPHQIKTRRHDFDINSALAFVSGRAALNNLSYGIEMESEAIECYGCSFSVRVIRCGLIIHKEQPSICGSPDGIVFKITFFEQELHRVALDPSSAYNFFFNCLRYLQGNPPIYSTVMLDMAPTTTIDDLPDDVLVEIFSYFTISHLMKSVQHVCQRWKHVVQFNDLWINLIYVASKQDEKHDRETISILRQAPKLRILNLRVRPVGFSVLRGVLKYCHNLRRLELNGHQNLAVTFFNSLLQECPLIEYLHIPNRFLSDVECSEVIARFENLKTLVVCEFLNQIYRVLLKPLADGCPALKHLNMLRGMHSDEELGYFLNKKKDQLISLSVRWTSVDWKNTISLLVVCRSLKSLHIDSYLDRKINGYMFIDIEPHFELFKCLSTGITSLTLSKLSYIALNDIVGIFSNKAMSHLKELRIIEHKNYNDEVGNIIIENCPHLTLLHIAECYHLSDKSVEKIFTLQDLENLNLSYSILLTSKGMKNVFKCESLKFLDLTNCSLLKVDSDLLHLKNLQVLKLSHCDVGGLPLRLLPSTMKCLSVLELINSQNTDEESLTELKRLMPHLLIKYKKRPDESNEGFMCPPINETTLGEAEFLVQQLMLD